MGQLALFNINRISKTALLDDINDYDKVLISVSGGKDSLALTLKAIEMGVDRSKIELFHQSVDGRHDTHQAFFDWPSTEGYVRRIAQALGVKLSWQWRDGGIKKEMYRENALTGDVFYQAEGSDDIVCLPTTKGTLSTRRKFPAKVASLSQRWCSSAAKIDPARRAITAREDLKGTNERPMKLCWLTGERREEGAARAKFDEIPQHPANSKARIVHWWRAIIDEDEQSVWTRLEKHRIRPHPVYYFFPRLSCRCCIFFGKNHWKSLKDISPEAFELVEQTERDLGFKIDQRFTVSELAAMGKSSVRERTMHHIPKIVSEWTDDVILAPGEQWELPAAAFGEGGGSI